METQVYLILRLFVLHLFRLTPFANLHHFLIHVHLVFGVLPFGWLRARTLPILHETEGTEQNREGERLHDQGKVLS
jgi:hypothetical protein